MVMPDATLVLDVRDLSTRFATPHGEIKAVNGISFQVRRGETLALVGESGSGKSVTSLSLMQLLGGRAQLSGECWLHAGGGQPARNLLALSPRQMRDARGRQLAMVFQEPMTSLNPLQRIGDQVAEAMEIHGLARGREAQQRAVELLALVGISDPALRARQYPHLLSGGMRQRVMIAMALACKPALLIADEPTTALDVTIQAQILRLIRRLQAEVGMGVLFITHDMGVVAQVADRVAVMYGGQLVEQASTAQLFRNPRHPYTRGLLDAVPRPGASGPLKGIPGQVEVVYGEPVGCRFANRCSRADERCRSVSPAWDAASSHPVRCHYPLLP
ncbi:ABC transporter ATP-binding protein [Acidovorax sp. JHL-9]|uniref:ABC transporter ATP-binding protein n=1 Tax=Acidovorax sp. JHL-9 TaxID=1276756 RepID=UPI0004292F22|nr:ABC transporter ATP-binding protein [Acidovorax sp. JHL-9]